MVLPMTKSGITILLMLTVALVASPSGANPGSIAEARQCASALTRWAIAEGKQEKIVKAVRLAANAMGSWRTGRDVDEFLRRILPIDWSEPQVVTVVARAEMGK